MSDLGEISQLTTAGLRTSFSGKISLPQEDFQGFKTRSMELSEQFKRLDSHDKAIRCNLEGPNYGLRLS